MKKVLLTRSRTRENSGVLRVFRGRAGLRVSCSSVSGGTCLMKKYLHTKTDSSVNATTFTVSWKPLKEVFNLKLESA